MLESNQSPFFYQHRYLLSKSAVRGLCITVTLIHCLLIGMISQNNSVVLSASAIQGGGGGNGKGSKGAEESVMRVNVFPISQKESVVKTVNVQKHSQQIISKSIEKKDFHFSAANKQQKTPTVSHQVANASTSEKGIGNEGGIGFGRGIGVGHGIGAGKGNGIGNGVGNGIGNGTGNRAEIIKVAASALRYRHAVRPQYPAISIERHEIGQALIKVVVRGDGSVQTAILERSSGYRRLDDAALVAARRSSFYPYIQNGVVLTVAAIIPYRFNLNE